MKFKNKQTGVVLEPTNKFVEEQLILQKEKYEIIKDRKTNDDKNGK